MTTVKKLIKCCKRGGARPLRKSISEYRAAALTSRHNMNQQRRAGAHRLYRIAVLESGSRACAGGTHVAQLLFSCRALERSRTQWICVYIYIAAALRRGQKSEETRSFFAD